MTYRLHVHRTYFRDSPTGGLALEDENGHKSWFGIGDDSKEFANEAEAWEWLGLDSDGKLPEDELVEGDNLDDQYTRTYRLEGDSVVVTDTPTTEFFSSSRITESRYTVHEVLR